MMTMKEVSKEAWLSALMPGDIGMNLAHNPFATVQNWYRKKFKDGPYQASHSFLVYSPPKIVEANGVRVDFGGIIKFVGGKTSVWAFRYRDMSPTQLNLMTKLAAEVVKVGGHYGFADIWSFAVRFFRPKAKTEDHRGMFCSELTTSLAIDSNLPYIVGVPPHEVSPSFQLNWHMIKGKDYGWDLAAHYDAVTGKYFVMEAVEKTADEDLAA
jgi:hypothetical protein